MGPSPATTPPPGATLPARHPATPPPGTELGQHYSRCFGCGEGHPTGLRLVAVAEDGVRVTARFTVTDDHQGAPGLAHGGLLAAAFDETLGMLLWVVGSAAVTGRLETDFIRPVPVGTTLHIDAQVTGVAGRKVYAVAEGRMNADDGPVAVRAAGLFVMVGPEHFRTHGRPAELAELAEQRRYNP